MSIILAIDTTSDACSAALIIKNKVLARNELAPRTHTQQILPMVDSLLKETGIALHEVDALAFGAGPGSFTGLRIAAGVVQGLAFAVNKPVVPVSSLRALAAGAMRIHRVTAVLAVTDARMQAVYWGAYQQTADGDVQALHPDNLTPPQQVTVPADIKWFGAGNGWSAYPAALTHITVGKQDPNLYPDAQDIARLAQYDFQKGLAVSCEQAIPIYLRNDVV